MPHTQWLYASALLWNHRFQVPTDLNLPNIFGTNGNDVVWAGSVDNNIYLQAGDDGGFGGDGADWLYGEAGNDVLDGGAEWDRLSGGAGSDVFLFRSGEEGAMIADFGPGDLIDLREVDGVEGLADLSISCRTGQTTIVAGDVKIIGSETSSSAFGEDQFIFRPLQVPVKAFDDTLAAQVEDAPARTIAFADLVGNDEQVADLQLSVAEIGNAAGGSVSIQDGAIRFEAAADFAGTAGFDYLVTDGSGGADTARASFRVTPVEDRPVAVDDRLPDVAENAAPSGSIKNSSCASTSIRMATR